MSRTHKVFPKNRCDWDWILTHAFDRDPDPRTLDGYVRQGCDVEYVELAWERGGGLGIKWRDGPFSSPSGSCARPAPSS